jgi:pimeloyl-ACP methyl ester carboxylesterase
MGLCRDITQSTCTVPSGLRLEVLSQAPLLASPANPALPALVFVHGSYHAAWCWAHWLRYFAGRGYACHALSLRGQGRGDHIDGTPTLDQHTSVRLRPSLCIFLPTIMARCACRWCCGAPPLTRERLLQDVAHFVGTLGAPSVLIGHSFGGLLVARYISGEAPVHCPEVVGAVMACSVPPYGNGPMVGGAHSPLQRLGSATARWYDAVRCGAVGWGGQVKRFLLSKPLASLRLTWSLAARGWDGNPKLFRESFFSPALPEPTLLRYAAYQAPMRRLESTRPGGLSRELERSLPWPNLPRYNTVC